MREIKFKAFDTETKVMTICRSLLEWFDAYSQFEFDTRSNQIDKIKRWVFLEYTGLKDKNGVEIYEGDILTGEEQRGCYTYSGSGFSSNAWMNKIEHIVEISPSNLQLTKYYANKSMVSGNIYSK